TLLAEPVDVRDLEVIGPELGQHQPAPLVDDDQKDVLGRVHAVSPRSKDCARAVSGQKGPQAVPSDQKRAHWRYWPQRAHCGRLITAGRNVLYGAVKFAEETTRGAFQDRDDRTGQHR